MFLYVFNYYIHSDILKILFCISIVINTFESIEGSMIQNYTLSSVYNLSDIFLKMLSSYK